jgi:hypothetical protein
MVKLWEGGRELGIMNHLGDEAGTYPLLSVYTSFVCAKGEVLLTTKSDPVGLGGIEVFESIDGCLLFLGLELRDCDKKNVRKGTSSKVRGYCTSNPLLVAQTPPA